MIHKPEHSSPLMAPTLGIAVLAALLLAQPSFASFGAQCSDHPLYKPGMKGVLLRSWTYRPRTDGSMYWTSSGYFAQYAQHHWAPVDDETSTKYIGLDFFASHNGDAKPELADFMTMNFQRPAKVYLMVHAWRDTGAKPSLAGWTSEGFVKLVKGEGNRVQFNLGTQKRDLYATTRAYIFSKVVKQSVSIGNHGWVDRNVKNLDTKGYWSLLIGEEDGKPTSLPAGPAGTVPGGRCPGALHDAWMTPGQDKSDRQTYRVPFRTWHPMWDPCFGCAYDHEHGSAAPLIMGYKPRYGYTALKDKGDAALEAHNGFKDLVLDLDDYYMYYSIHAKMSDKSRFTTRFHTKVIAVTRKSDGALMAELRFKADYGHREVRTRGRGSMALTPKDDELKELSKYPKCRRQRLVNVIDMTNLDTRFRYRDGAVQAGQYEQWSTCPLCSDTFHGREPTVDFKDMALAMKNTAGTGETVLGRMRDGKLVRHVSVNRELRVRNWVFSDSLCVFYLPDIYGKAVDGVFYTDPFGAKLLSGPGPKAIRQYIKPGFKLTITGEFNTADTWIGIHRAGVKGSFKNIGFAIDADVN